jgi:hypothetical protein
MAGKGRYFSAGLRNMTCLVLRSVVCDGGRQRAAGGLTAEHDARDFRRSGGNHERAEDGHGDGGSRRGDSESKRCPCSVHFDLATRPDGKRTNADDKL